MGIMCVSSCRCCVFVCDASGDHMVERTRVWVLLWLCMLR